MSGLNITLEYRKLNMENWVIILVCNPVRVVIKSMTAGIGASWLKAGKKFIIQIVEEPAQSLKSGNDVQLQAAELADEFNHCP